MYIIDCLCLSTIYLYITHLVEKAMLRKKEREQSELLRAHQRKSGDQDEGLGEQNMKECHSLKMRGDYER